MKKTHKIVYLGKPIGSLDVLAKTLTIPTLTISAIRSNIQSQYTVFVKPVKGKDRELAEPNHDLKLIQKRIISRVFSNIMFPHYLHGGIKDFPPRDFVSNANAHSKAESAITLDIKRFFPSITAAHVMSVYKNLFHFPPPVAAILTELTTLNDALPQGAPTSSYIANLIMFDQEYKLAARFEGMGYSYTRLIDDITVSSKKQFTSEDKNSIVKQLFSLINSYGFEVHPTKKHFFNRKNPEDLMQITGLWLNRGAPRIAKTRRQEIAREVIGLRNSALGLSERYKQSFHDEYNSISGKVSLLTRIGHTESPRLRKIMEGIPPIYDKSGEIKIKRLVYNFHKKSKIKSGIGYMKRFYKLQSSIAILKRSNKTLAKELQSILKKHRPCETIRSIYA